jgi:glucose-1-phosphate adenylyltransferase
MRDTLAMILAGGVGSRLNILVKDRAKPAVPFGGIFRIIDFALSNVMNSGLNQVAVLTQYKPLSLMRHIGDGSAWDFVGRTRGVKILPPRTGEQDSDWYKGTADAVRQNMDFIEDRPSRDVLILSGDHIYFMDYQDMVRHHREVGAKVTVAMMTVPWDQTSQFGIGILDGMGRIVEWEEKPEQARSNLASMGIYVFDTLYLLEALRATKEVDFGHHIIPKAMADGELYGYIFNGYWRDVGTICSLWDANMDMIRNPAPLDAEGWGVVTNLEAEGLPYDRAPARILPGAVVKNSAISPGCVISGHVENSVISPGVIVEKGAIVKDSVIMHNTWIGSRVSVHRTVCDKAVRFAEGSRVGIGDASVPNREYPKHLYAGLTLIGKKAEVPQNAHVGTNCIVFPRTGSDLWPQDRRLADGESLMGRA